MLGNIIVALIVLVAVFFTVRHFYKVLSGKSGCGCGCGSKDKASGSSSGCCGGSSGCGCNINISK